MRMKIIILSLNVILLGLAAQAQVKYPYPVNFFSLQAEGQQVKMAYMDIAPAVATGKNIVLLHGKNFNGYYWKNIISFLVDKGYRVIVPDQVGWGKSDHPNLHYSFFLLANFTHLLLDSLGINKTVVIGHSMGGMLATRFTLMYPGTVTQLVLENPIGLEDYATFVPWRPLQELLAREKSATFESYKKYQQSYYPVWKPEYEQYVSAQAADLNSPGFQSIAFCNAITYQMIFEQPVVYEFNQIKVPTLLIIGTADRTIVGKDQLNEATQNVHGQYQIMGRQTQFRIPGSRLVELAGVGHIPHIQEPGKYMAALEQFINK